MELIERINALEGEVKLVKTEIKKVLVDLRELMNNYENPFVNVERLRETIPMEETKKEPKGLKEESPAEEEEEEPVYKPEHEPVVNTGVKAKHKQLATLKKVEGSEKMDIFTLTQLMKWADTSLSNVGKEKLNEIIGLYELTGRLPKETKEVIFRIEDLSTVNSQNKDKIEMKDCILAIYQLDRIITGETGAQAPLMLSEDELAKWLKVQ